MIDKRVATKPQNSEWTHEMLNETLLVCTELAEGLHYKQGCGYWFKVRLDMTNTMTGVCSHGVD